MDMAAPSMDLLLNQAQSNAANAQSKSLLNRKIESQEEARQVAEEFESVFLSTMVDTMFSGIETDGPFGGGHAEGIYRSMMNEEYAKAIVASGGIGIADQVYAEILKAQEIPIRHQDAGTGPNTQISDPSESEPVK